jgi:deazaflavin-dependent oxidoreductase (nitroreductase family)
VQAGCDDLPVPTADDLSALADEPFAYVTTTGRRTGAPHTIEIWFGVDRDVVYLMAGGRDRSDWVRNLIANPHVKVRIREHEWDADARPVDPDTEEDARVRPLLRDKYADASDDLVGWARQALPVALALRD